MDLKVLNPNLQSFLLDFFFDAILKPLISIEHAAVTDNGSILNPNSLSFLLLLLISFMNHLMFSVFIAAAAREVAVEQFTWTARAILFVGVVVHVGVFAGAFEVLAAVDGHIVVVEAFTALRLAFDFAVGALEVVVHFVGVVAETF